MKKKLTIVAAVVLATCLLAACGGTKGYDNVGQYYNQDTRLEDVEAQIFKLMDESNEGIFEEVRIEAKGNKVIFNFYLNEGVAVADYEPFSDILDNEFDSSVDKLREDSGIESTITYEYHFYDSFGTELYSFSNEG